MSPLPAEDPRAVADYALRTLWKHAAPALAQVALGKPLRQVAPRDPSAIAVGRAPDALALVTPVDGTPCTVFLEFEAAPRERLARRMALNTFLLHGQDGPPVRGVALLLEPSEALDGRYEMTHDGHVLASCAYSVVCLSELSPEALLDAGQQNPGLLPLVGLCGNATLTHVGSAAKVLAQSERVDAQELHAIAFVLAGRNFGYDLIKNLFAKETLMRSSTWDWILEQGIEKGMEKGIEKGIEKGRHEGQRQTVVQLAALRGGPELATLIAQIPDAKLSEALVVLAKAHDAETARPGLLTLIATA